MEEKRDLYSYYQMLADHYADSRNIEKCLYYKELANQELNHHNRSKAVMNIMEFQSGQTRIRRTA